MRVSVQRDGTQLFFCRFPALLEWFVCFSLTDDSLRYSLGARAKKFHDLNPVAFRGSSRKEPKTIGIGKGESCDLSALGKRYLFSRHS
jgi:hypothetical protein